jgi:hypothetical protein
MENLARDMTGFSGLVHTMDTGHIVSAACACDEMLAEIGYIEKANTGRLAEARLRNLLLAQFQGKAKTAMGGILSRLKAGEITPGRIDDVLTWAAGQFNTLSQTEVRQIIMATSALYAAEKGALAKTMGIKYALRQMDQNAIQALAREQVWWIGDFYNDALSARVRDITTRVMLESGYNRTEAARQLERQLSNQFGITAGTTLADLVPSTFPGSVRSYFKGLAGTIQNRAANIGRVSAFTEAGVATYKIEAVMDQRTSEICQMMDGQVFEIEVAQKYVADYMGAKTKDEALQTVQWQSPNQIAGMGSADLAKAGMALPPYHFRCRTVVVVHSFRSGSVQVPAMDALKPGAKPDSPVFIPPDPVGSSLRNGQIMNTTPLGAQQASNEAFWVTMEDGTVGIMKPAAGEHKELLSYLKPRPGAANRAAAARQIKPGSMAIREAAVSDFDHNVTRWGIVPRTVTREVEGHGFVSIQERVPGARTAVQINSDTPRRFEKLLRSKRVQQMDVMDAMFANGDRHTNNYLFSRGKVWAIDNGLAAPQGPPRGGNAFRLANGVSKVPDGMRTDRSVIQFLRNTSVDDVAESLTSSGLDQPSVDAAVARFKYMKENVALLQDNSFYRGFRLMVKGMADEGLMGGMR